MLYFSFGNLAFNGKSSESMIDIVISGKSKFKDADAFLVDAIKYMDEEIYPGEGIKEEYNGAHLKEGLYKEIVMRWIASMNEKIDIWLVGNTGLRNPNRIQDGFKVFAGSFPSVCSYGSSLQGT